MKESAVMEPTIICPKCKNEIKLTESLAAPLIETTRREYEQRLTQKDTDIAKRETVHRRDHHGTCCAPRASGLGPLPFSTTLVPLRKARARHERNFLSSAA